MITMQRNRSQTRYILWVLLAVLLPASPGAAEETPLAALVRTALEQNHAIQAARSRVEEADQRSRQAGTLPDPRLGVEYFLQSIETRVGPQETAISLSQSIPWPGRLRNQRELKHREADIARVMLRATQLGVVRRLKETYVEYAYLSRARDITSQILELMRYLEGIARTNYTSGKASYTDVLKIQIEIDRLRNRVHSLEDNGTPLVAAINSLLGREPGAAAPIPAAIPTLSLSHDDEEIHEMARQHSPVLETARQKIARDKAGLDLAEQGYFPDLAVSVKTILTGEAEYGDPPDSGRDAVIAGLTLTLPVFFDRREGAIAEKQAALRAAQSERKQVFYDLSAGVETQLFRYREAARLLELYDTELIPRVRQELDVALEAFQGGEYSILELMDAEKSWLRFELARARARADMALQVARLEELTGATLADWEDNG
ncbi:MAG: hypothetical protein Kow0089_12290 [Desulfobulbaceae bacterium]